MLQVHPVLLLLSHSLFILQPSYGQKKEPAAIEAMITALKGDLRGPYRDIRWFCKAGSTLPHQERCLKLTWEQWAWESMR